MPAAPSGFVPLVLPAESVPSGKFLPITEALQPSTPPAPCPGHPLVRIKQENGRVASIHIECTCGQVIDLDCQY